MKEKSHEHAQWIACAATVASRATCTRSRCGSVIVRDGNIIGEGYNSPPAHSDTQRRCANEKSVYDAKVTDKTCCVHAEERAIMNAIAHHPDALSGSTLYFVRLDEKGNAKSSGKPYCTICSKLALDVGIASFVLLHKDGPHAYDTREYNDLSYGYTSNSLDKMD